MATPMGSHLIALLWGRCASAPPRAIGTAERSPRRRVLGRSLPQNTEGTNPTERSRSGNSGDAHQRAARGKQHHGGGGVTAARIAVTFLSSSTSPSRASAADL